MLPDFRQLVAMTCLALSVLIFAFGAAALLRSAHDDFAAMQSQRAGREPGRAQFALNHGSAPAVQISDATAAPRDAETSSEPNLAALQLPEARAAEPASAKTDIAAKVPNNTPNEPIVDPHSTLTIADRAAAPILNLPGNDAVAAGPPARPAEASAVPDPSAALKNTALPGAGTESKAKDVAAISGSAEGQAYEAAKIQAFDKETNASEMSGKDLAANNLAAKNLTTKDESAQTRIAALDPSGSARAVTEQPSRRVAIRRAKKPNARAALLRKRILAARQRAAQANRPAPQQAATNTVSSGNLFIQGGN